tara:strand:- start:310 stop:735 length:426 start_codon:yes stop_codon:yes gene_type:complete
MIKKILFIFLLLLIFISLTEKLDNTYYLNSEEKVCCLIEKQVDKNGFYYHYTKTKCNNDLEKNLNSERLLTNEQFPLKMCNYYDERNKKFPKKLGSCRNVNHECFDFINKEKCNKYKGMRWESVPCNMPILYENKIKKYKI